MLGIHLIHLWSRTQAVVALSIAEAELNASVKGASEGIQLKHAAFLLLSIQLSIDVTDDPVKYMDPINV